MSDLGDSLPIVVTGAGRCVVGEDANECDPLPYLKVKKLRKYMGVQDDLAVIAASRAVANAGLAETVLSERTGLYWATGFIPFEDRALKSLAAAATDPTRNAFSMRQLSTTGFHALNGLLTFHCLPNMPAFHISANLDLQGPYFVTYPGAGEWYVALDEACWALRQGEVAAALVGGVAYQNNALVQHHLERLERPVPAASLRDAAGCLVLQRVDQAQASGVRVLATLRELELQYEAFDPFSEEPVFHDEVEWQPAPASRLSLPRGGDESMAEDFGPAGPAVVLSRLVGNTRGVVRHRLTARNGIVATASWELS